MSSLPDASPDFEPRHPAPAPSGDPPMPTADPLAAPTEAVEPAPALDVVSGEEIEALLRQARAPEPGEAPVGVRKGRITNIVGEDVFVDLDDQTKGTVSRLEFAKDAPPVVGEDVHVIIERYDPAGGFMLLSKRKADRELMWARLKAGAVVEGHVTAMNKGGLEVDLGGLRAFMPSSQCDVHRMKDISTLLNLVIRCEVLEVNRGAGEVIVSRRNALIREREDTRQRMLGEIEEGQTRKGVVGNLTDYGAFVNLGGVDALLHISDMSWGHVRRPAEVLQPGQEIEVKVLKVDRAKGKVSVGLKQTKPNPWETVEEKYPVGTRVRGRVTQLASFGAFLEIEDGLEGLIPLSEMSWVKRVHKASDVVQQDAVIEVVVIGIDKPKRRLSLGLKQIAPDPWTGIADRYPRGAVVPGKVARLSEFGAFVELEPGIDGLIHISEMSEKRIKSPDEVVQPGKEVQVRILGVDADKRRISLSLRPAPVEQPPSPAEIEKARKKEKKKPLRGGLSSHWDWAADLKLRLKG